MQAQLPTAAAVVAQATSAAVAQTTAVPGPNAVIQVAGNVLTTAQGAANDITAAVTPKLRHCRRGYQGVSGNQKRGADLGKDFEDLPYRQM